MALETATYINQLVDTNPVHTDGLDYTDSHLRLIKACIQASFPNFTAAALASSNAQIDAAVALAGTSVQAAGNGSVPTGSIHSFPADPGTTLCARSGTATGTEQFILLDGATYAVSKFPTLGASPFVTVVSGNFTVPKVTDTGRFLRSHIPGTTTPGTTQANQNASHTHTLTDPGHTHTVTDPGHNHTLTDPGHHHSGGFVTYNQTATGGSLYNSAAENTGTATTGITLASATTGITNVSTTTGITMASEGGTEARPESFVVFMTIKT